jgi:hypothetical protein
MDRYFFNLRDGDALYIDPDGEELIGIDAAIAEAYVSARHLLAERLRAGAIVDGQVFEISDEAGEVFARVPLKDALKLPESFQDP